MRPAPCSDIRESHAGCTPAFPGRILNAARFCLCAVVTPPRKQKPAPTQGADWIPYERRILMTREDAQKYIEGLTDEEVILLSDLLEALAQMRRPEQTLPQKDQSAD